MLRAQIGQCAVFKTPTKLQHPYCNSFEAIAIGKLDLVLDRRNVSLFRDLATEPIFTPRISQPLNTGSEYKNTNVFFILKYLKATVCMHARRRTARTVYLATRKSVHSVRAAVARGFS